MIHHVGRRSGRAYETPVVAVEHDGCFLVALPYGERTDWLRNVLAMGKAEITTGGKGYPVDRPEVIPISEGTLLLRAEGAAPPPAPLELSQRCRCTKPEPWAATNESPARTQPRTTNREPWPSEFLPSGSRASPLASNAETCTGSPTAVSFSPRWSTQRSTYFTSCVCADAHKSHASGLGTGHDLVFNWSDGPWKHWLRRKVWATPPAI